jgi:hypothetical protein
MAFGDLVQSNGGTGAASSSFSATLGSAITAGNLVVIMVTANNVPSGANTGWTKSTGMSPVANAQGLLWWFIGTAGQAIPSITPTAGQNYLLVAGIGGQDAATSWNVASVTIGSLTNSFVNVTQQFRQASAEAHIACQASRVITSASGSYTTTGTPSTTAVGGGSCRIGCTIAFKRGTGATNYTMPAATGTLTPAGQTVALRAARKTVAGLGTLTLAGQAAALRAGRKTVAGLGTLTLSGRAAVLARSRKMPAVTGTLTLAGPVVNLIYSGAGSKVLPAGIGFLALGGQAAVLRRTRKMPVTPGTLTLSGRVVDLVYTEAVASHYVMTVETGNLALIGQPAGLVADIKNHYVMAAGSSTLMMTGFPASVYYGPALQQPGVFKFGRRVTIPNRW